MIFLFLSLFFLVPDASATAIKLSLQEAISHALSQNAELAAERTTVAQASADRDRVAGEFGPHIEALAGVGPNYAATGDVLYGSTNHSKWGRTFLGNISVTQPLYSFGRRASYERAAEAGTKVKESGVRLKEDEVRFQVKEAYYGYLAAKSLIDFIHDARADLDRAIKDRTKLNKKEGYRLDLFLAQVDAKEAELKKAVLLAEEALQLRIGAAANETFLPREEWIDTNERELKSLDSYLELARKQRGEFMQLRQGISAKHELATAEHKALFPVFAFLTKYEFADTNVRTKQISPFAYDPYNHDSLEVGVGLKWDLQWGLPQAKAAKLNAEAEELEAKSIFADRGILTEVKRAYWELEEANARLTAATTANRTTKKWLSSELMVQGSGLGNGKTDDLTAAYGARGEAVKSYYEAIYEQQLAWARLSKAAGIELDPLLR